MESVIYNKNNYEMNSNYNREFVPFEEDSSVIKLNYRSSLHNSYTKDTDTGHNYGMPEKIVIDKRSLEYVLPTKYFRSRPRSSIKTSYYNGTSLGFRTHKPATKLDLK